jgi:cyanophycinase
MSKRAKGKLIIIGGAERKEEGQGVLRTVAEAISGGKHLLIVTTATQQPEETGAEYTQIFHDLGVAKVTVVDIRTRSDADLQDFIDQCEQADGIFFTGGDQLRITSQMGDSRLFQCMRERYLDGAVIAGTSAGAAAMPYTMIIGGPGDESNRISALSMAPGLGMIDDMVIDSHFAERGRMGRLIGAVTQNPRNLGVGIDEATAIVVSHGQEFEVIGQGAVYVVDGARISYSGLSEANPEGIVTVHDVTVHVLGAQDRFDLVERRPIKPAERQDRKASQKTPATANGAGK